MTTSIDKFFDLFAMDGFDSYCTVTFCDNQFEISKTLKSRDTDYGSGFCATNRQVEKFIKYGPKAIRLFVWEAEEENIEQLETNILKFFESNPVSVVLEVDPDGYLSDERMNEFYKLILSSLPPSVEYLDLSSSMCKPNHYHHIPSTVHSIHAPKECEALKERTGDIWIDHVEGDLLELKCHRLLIEKCKSRKLCLKAPELASIESNDRKVCIKFLDKVPEQIMFPEMPMGFINSNTTKSLMVGEIQKAVRCESLIYLHCNKYPGEEIMNCFPNLQWFTCKDKTKCFGKISELSEF